jgi:hypothetical protein
MPVHRHFDQFAAALLMLVVAAAQGSSQLVSNGGFETPSLAEGAFLTIFPGMEPPGFRWTVVRGSIDLANLPVFPFVEFDAIEGEQGVDLNGIDRGTIFQDIETVAGQRYTLSFWFADNPFEGGESSADILVTDVISGDTLLLSTVFHSTSTNGPPPNGNQELFDDTFTAIGTLTRLIFSSTSPSNSPSGGILIDAVDVVEAACLLGDMNLDSAINLLDVAPFVAAITNGEYICEADINEDLSVDLLDVAPFVMILSAG